MDLNKVILIGNLTRDPESRKTITGKVLTRLSLATNQKFKEKKLTQFHSVVGWQKLAEIMAKFLKKGDKIYIEGQLRNRNFVGRDGVKHFFTEIVASNLIMFNGKRKIEVQTEQTEEEDPAKVEIEEKDIPF